LRKNRKNSQVFNRDIAADSLLLKQQAEETRLNYEKLQAKVKEQRQQFAENEKRKKEIETKKFEVRLKISSLVPDGFEKQSRTSQKNLGKRVLRSYGAKYSSKARLALFAKPKHRLKLE